MGSVILNDIRFIFSVFTDIFVIFLIVSVINQIFILSVYTLGSCLRKYLVVRIRNS